jgi:hypothetical protein
MRHLKLRIGVEADEAALAELISGGVRRRVTGISPAK